MKRIIQTVLLLCLLPFSTAHAWQGRVVKVLDGDSIRVKKGSKIIEVRLYGIDCPEWNQAYGKKAKQFSRAKVYQKRVDIDPVDIDRYGRTVAIVSRSGKLLNRQLVQAGLAWQYKKYCKKKSLCSKLAQLEKEAKRRKRGLWRSKKPVAPWTWRKAHKKGRKSRKEK